MVKLKCKHCKYEYEISEAELKDNGELYRYCIVCGGEIEILNLDELCKNDIYKKAEEYINKWVYEIGWDNVLDLLKRNKNNACYKIYKEILQKRGFKIGE
jgi:hypothetical protein